MERSRVLVSLVTLASAATAGIALACIIPDTDIYVYSLDSNASPVRIVEGIPLSEEARCACGPNSCECPIPDQTGLPTFLDPSIESYQFCVCGENEIDAGRLNGVTLFAEDQDELDDGENDPLFAALLLDWSPTLGEPASDYVAYDDTYLDPSIPLNAYVSSYENLIIKRPRPFARSIELSDDTDRFDLCNGAGQTLTQGFHTLTLIVTDRPWFQTSGGSGDETSDDGPEPMPIIHEGVPNIAEGATYDIETYVFHCFAEGEVECQCETPPEP